MGIAQDRELPFPHLQCRGGAIYRSQKCTGCIIFMAHMVYIMAGETNSAV